MASEDKISGYFIEEDGQRYFIHGDTKIRAVEHFNPNGPTFQEIMFKIICKEAEKEGLL